MSVVLLALVGGIYAQTASFGFVLLDDDIYITENPTVQAGLTVRGLRYAFSAEPAPMTNPLALVSHMIDVELFGLDAGKHHVVNVLLHAVNSVLLLVFLTRATRQPWPGFVVAALFAVHPLHVENVAWVSDRKDLMSATFWMLGFLTYVELPERRRALRIGLVTASFALAVLAKPMALTFPFVLLLLDVWPLGRVSATMESVWSRRYLVWEKVPMFAIVILASYVTWYMQETGNSTQQGRGIPLAERIAGAAAGYGVYLRQAIAPYGLGAFYPLDRGVIDWPAALTGATCVAAGLIASFRLRQSQPWFGVGWLWFLGTLVPVIGLVQVGAQSHADRYMYIPSIGLSIALVWTARSWIASTKRPWFLGAARTAAAAAILVYAAVAYAQTAHWKDAEEHLLHTLETCGPSGTVANNLGAIHRKRGEYEEAAGYFQMAIDTGFNHYLPYYNMGAMFCDSGRYAEAIPLLEKSLEIAPSHAESHVALALALLGTGKPELALEHAQKSIQFDPPPAHGYAYAAISLQHLHRNKEALPYFRRSSELDPSNAITAKKYGAALLEEGEIEAASREIERGLTLAPRDPEMHYLAGIADKRSGQLESARERFRRAVELDPAADYASRELKALER